MTLDFFKYQGTGNDFVILDNRLGQFPKENQKLIAHLCHRNFGIGADGLILLENDDHSDFRMVYFNADGNESTMCGNGGRCIVAFAQHLGIFDQQTTFNAIDGLHHATMTDGIVSLQMIDVAQVEIHTDNWFVNTGSPHDVRLVKDLHLYDVYTEGKQIRNSVYGKEGSNVNFVEQLNDDTFKVRTYERGVENETLACGTGVTAVALAMYTGNYTQSQTVKLPVQGGQLEVSFKATPNGFTDIFLTGPAQQVFQGTIKAADS